MKHGVFFFLSHTPVLCSLSGAGGCEDELGRPVGVWAVGFSLLLRGPGWVFLSPRRSEGGSAPGSGADYPLGVVVPGSRSIECIWGV